MIEQLGAMLSAIRRHVLAGEATREETGASLRDAARLGGLDYDLARVMAPETLLMMVAPAGDVDPGRCWLLAELSYIDGLEAGLADDPDLAREAFERAGYLFGLLQPVAGNFLGIPESADRVKEIEQRLSELPAVTD
jgi:hypothetical protein